ncbi:SGNH/GDSL hydrolase family protein [Pseudoluteimonas lycopersici]|uniref:SGNH/GDSL hydrolase family protein n=1 Tax=Pseudoluteimonas lycopersici TaxID=1324796 RepID=A0A516V5P5_9GAMM|nr:SGNH/GDSL hydrolase family protein [Lysobacter lycopersici]QDQ73850.1 SGNH/GDSL hydrolase family protein [Lysobacter lycopersici]
MLTYLALGDSYTIGEGVPEADRWPVRLAALLRDEGIDLWPPRIIAQTGWTTDELSTAMDAAEPLDEWDFISLLIGVNNQYRGRPIDDYREQFSALLERLVGYAHSFPHGVIVLSIPDWGVTPFARDSGRDLAQIAAELDAYNRAAREICASLGVAFVDITGISREGGGEPDMLVSDGLHPSAAMYARWAQAALPVAREMLRWQDS